MVGKFHSDGSSQITASSADINDAGTVKSFAAITGSFSSIIGQRARIDGAFPDAQYRWIHFLSGLAHRSLFCLNANIGHCTKWNGDGDEPSAVRRGRAKRQSGGPFANASLNGEYVVDRKWARHRRKFQRLRQLDAFHSDELGRGNDHPTGFRSE